MNDEEKRATFLNALSDGASSTTLEHALAVGEGIKARTLREKIEKKAYEKAKESGNFSEHKILKDNEQEAFGVTDHRARPSQRSAMLKLRNL